MNRGTTFKVAVAGLAMALAAPAFAFAQTESTPAQPAPAQAQPAPMMRGGHGFGHMFGRGMLRSLQDTTGLSGQEIRQQLADGKTLLQIAESKGKTADDLVAAARQAMQDKLAEAVKDGWITQERADARLKTFDEQKAAMAEMLKAAPGQMRMMPNGEMPNGKSHGDCPFMKDKTDGSQPGLWYNRLRSGNSSDT